ncbi:hypothetical protein OG301_20200 [Streptomyces platensis]|uniref:hypothetical protein n=1 Tax=Streptomyces platensis TaxID=58346 RepID=UPI002ED63F89|nr:hypothetical protein OG301_20200 [Streptomyces platensis]
MTEIVAAFIGGVFALGAAVITVRWTRSRSTGDPVPDQMPPTSNAQSDGVTINAPQSGQIIGTNNGTVSQTNYRDGKR